jgi:hypothetical protein
MSEINKHSSEAGAYGIRRRRDSTSLFPSFPSDLSSLLLGRLSSLLLGRLSSLLLGRLSSLLLGRLSSLLLGRLSSLLLGRLASCRTHFKPSHIALPTPQDSNLYFYLGVGQV